MADLPDAGKTVQQLERELQMLIAERATASELRELRAEIKAVKDELKAKADAEAASGAEEDDGFSID